MQLLRTVLLLGVGVAALRPSVPETRRLAPLRSTTYPALDDAAIIELFRDVPVFTLADEKGQLVLLNDGKQKAIEFYVDVKVAVKRKQYWDEDKGKLSVTASSLGKALTYGSVAARFVASPQELKQARQLLVRSAGGDPKIEDPEALLAAYEAIDPDRRFGEPTDIPLFCISQLKLGGGLTPWFFSMDDCVLQWREACGDDKEALLQGEVDILSLKEMVMLMRAPSADEDHTSRIFIPAKSSLEAIGKKPPASDSEA